VERAVLTIRARICRAFEAIRRSQSSALCKSAVAERESGTFLVQRNEKAPLSERESAYTYSIWA
jgi:hypothetical protein